MQKSFESDEYILAVRPDHFLHFVKDESEFRFKDLAKIKVIRSQDDDHISRITYRIRGQIVNGPIRLPSWYQIDGFKPQEMEQIAALLKDSAKTFSIEFSDGSRV